MVNRHCSRNGIFGLFIKLHDNFFLKILFIWKKIIVNPRKHLAKNPLLFRPQYRLNHSQRHLKNKFNHLQRIAIQRMLFGFNLFFAVNCHFQPKKL